MTTKITDKNVEMLMDQGKMDMDMGLSTPGSLTREPDKLALEDVKKELPSLATLKEHQKVVKSAQLAS